MNDWVPIAACQKHAIGKLSMTALPALLRTIHYDLAIFKTA
jgi:hypothetical protein